MLLLHSTTASPRVRYTLGHLLQGMLGWNIRWASSLEEFRSSSAPRVLYGDADAAGAYRFSPEPLLDQGGAGAGVHFHALRRALRADDPCPPLSTIFFFLSLWEEQHSARHDAHGRVPAEELTATHLVNDPLRVDRTALALADALRAHHPGLPAPTRRFRHVLTVDVDNGLKFLGRPLHRAIGAGMKDLLRGDPSVLRDRWATRLGLRNDPFTRWPVLLEDARTGVDRRIAFILASGQGAHDHAASLEHRAYGELLRTLPSGVETGLHPSYASGGDAGVLMRERARLEAATGRRIVLSRQHFLRMRLPGTYRALLAAGIREDHSLGHHDRAGFRAATCTPFPWYDLEREEATDLICWPFAVMDSALHERMGLGPEAALEVFDRMRNAVRGVQGTLVSVWHDRYLSGYRSFAPWPGVMHRAVHLARA